MCQDACFVSAARIVESTKGQECFAATLSDEEKEDLLEWAHSAILLSLGDEVLREIVDEEIAVGLWL